MTALICLTYDDALPIHREVVAPLLAERGLRGTFYIPAARDDLHEHLADWRNRRPLSSGMDERPEHAR